MCTKAFKYPAIHPKEQANKLLESSELSHVLTAIECKHKYFLLIKKVSSRCILPQGLLPALNNPPTTTTLMHTHAYTLL